MSKQIQLRRGNISSFSAFTPAQGEPTFVNDRSTMRIGDGSTAGGIELARNGYLVKSVAGGSNVSLSEAEAARPFIEFTGILTGNIQVIFPITLNSGKLYLIKNSTTGSFTLTVIGTSGTGVVLPQSGVGLFSHDGTNMVSGSGTGSYGYFGDGTASLPSISFSADTNTGIYRVGNDSIGISTGGVNSLTIGSNQYVGIFNTSPQSPLHVGGTISLNETSLGTRYALTPKSMGYNSTYRALMIGSASTSYNTNYTGSVTISFNYDPSINASGSFSGDGREIIFRNGTQFLNPISSDTSWAIGPVLQDGNLLIGTTSTTGLTGAGGLKLNSSTASSSTTTGSFITAGGVGIGGAIVAAGNITVGSTSIASSYRVSSSFDSASLDAFAAINTNSTYARTWVFGPNTGVVRSFTFRDSTGSSNYFGFYDGSAAKPGTVFCLGTTEATTAGAGALEVSGGIYATKAIVSGSTTDSTSTTTGGLILAGGAAIAKTLTTAGRILSTSIKTTTYTITTSDSVIVCNSSSAFTVSLPSLASASTGRQYIIKNKGAGQITLTASGSETIDGSVSVYINQYESLTIVSDGATWNVI